MKLINIEQFKREIYYNSPKWIQKKFWNIYLNYIKFKALKNGNIINMRDSNNPFEIIYLEPKQIKFSLTDVPSGEKFKNIGQVKDGSWDLNTINFEDNKAFIGLKEHFIKGIPLERTEFYSNILKNIDSGNMYWGCKTKEELEKRFRAIDELYLNIKSNGYKTQKELGNQVYLDEITVNINRKGEFIFEDGIHRLSIAIILGYKKIPVIITKRHYLWNKFKNEVFSYSQRNFGKVYQPLLHPDLKDIPSLHTDDRWNIILKNNPLKSGTVLDIGSQWGYFSHKFEDFGFNCTAVENNPVEFYYLEKLRDAEGRKFEIISKSILDIEIKNYDIILALNIFHHFLKTNEDFNKLKKFLNKIHAEVLFFEPHIYNEVQMKNSYINFNEIEFNDYIIENSCFTQYKFIGEAIDGRKLFMFT